MCREQSQGQAEFCFAFLYSGKTSQRTCHWPQMSQGVNGAYSGVPEAWTSLLGLWGLEGGDASHSNPLGCSLSPRVTRGQGTWCHMVNVTPCTAVPS